MKGYTARTVPEVMDVFLWEGENQNHIVNDRVLGCHSYPPGTHDHDCIRDDFYAVVIETAHGRRTFGTPKCAIGPDLKFHMLINDRDEVLSKWDVSEFPEILEG